MDKINSVFKNNITRLVYYFCALGVSLKALGINAINIEAWSGGAAQTPLFAILSIIAIYGLITRAIKVKDEGLKPHIFLVIFHLVLLTAFAASFLPVSNVLELSHAIIPLLAVAMVFMSAKKLGKAGYELMKAEEKNEA